MLRRRVLGAAGSTILTATAGCLWPAQSVRQPYGDLVVRNDHSRSHAVRIDAVNEHANARDGQGERDESLELDVEPDTAVRETEFFSAGETDVTVSVDGSRAGRATVDVWRGEGGDDDRHEETLEVTIESDGGTSVDVTVTHTPP